MKRLLFFISLLISIYSHAQKPAEATVKAVRIYHFCKNVLWEKKADERTFSISVLTNDDEYYETIQKILTDKRVNDKSIKVHRISNLKNLKGGHVLVLGEDKKSLVDDFYDLWQGKEILLITDDYNDVKRIMINFYETEDHSIRFQVNKANIFIQGLSVLPELLIDGGSEIDIAEVYKNVKNDLEKAQKELEFEKKILELQQKELQRLKYDYGRQRDSMAAQKKILSAQHDIIADQQKQITEQSDWLEEYNRKLQVRQEEIKQTTDSLSNTVKFIEKTELELEKLKKQKKDYDRKISNQLNQIDYQKKVINNQKEEISSDQLIISEQQFYLILQICVIILAIGLILVTYRGFILKKRSSQILKVQKEKLEQTIFELQEAQSQLIQSEKMATLGQLTAGVAHEINTPLGAILSSGENMETILTNLTTTLPEVIRLMDENELAIFKFLIDNKRGSVDLSTRERRSARKKIRQQLEKKTIEKPAELAEILVEMCTDEDIDKIYPLLKKKERFKIIDSAYVMAILFKNSRNIREAVEKATKVLFALKKYTRKGGGSDDQKTGINLIDNIETVLMIYNNSMRNTEVIKSYESKDVVIMGYPDELSQVWTNLVQNALHAMDENGVLTIKTYQENEHIIVAISDNGPGITEENQTNIFKPFFTTKPIGEGTGLGLDIVQRIVNRHEGKITFESILEVGTTFYVYLPLN